MTDQRLAQRHVLVTGAAQGIGRGIARRVARAGADVTIFDVDADTAAETAEAIRDAGSRAAVYEVDVADGDAVTAAVDDATNDLGPIHGLVNNAGIQHSIPILSLTDEEWDAHMNVNARGVFHCCQAVGSHMVEAGIEGSIVNVASTAAERPFAGQGVYAASKAAVVAFTIVLAKELGEHGITANCINPGTVDTPMVQEWLAENAEQGGVTEDEVLADALDQHILDRMGEPEEVGHLATLLLSEEGAWLTGESINLDGGYTKV